jgi:signal peptidase I
MEILRKIYVFLLDSVQTFLVAAAIFLFIYVTLFRPFEVKGQSMYPNFHDQEYVLTNLIGFQNLGFYRVTTGKLTLGDVIVFSAPPEPDKDYIKRVIGTPGDTILLSSGKVYLNGEQLDESKYLNPEVKTYGGAFLKDEQSIKIPNDGFFVMGDNRMYSSDSREWGFVKRSEIVGKSGFVYWPINRMRLITNPYKGLVPAK